MCQSIYPESNQMRQRYLHPYTQTFGCHYRWSSALHPEKAWQLYFCLRHVHFSLRKIITFLFSTINLHSCRSRSERHTLPNLEEHKWLFLSHDNTKKEKKRLRLKSYPDPDLHSLLWLRKFQEERIWQL